MMKSALNHSCEKQGCARRFLDPKLHEFDDCFGGEFGPIRMGDIDGAVERNGHILWMEWKRGAVLDDFDKKHCAQVIMAKAFTRNSQNHTFVFVLGCPVNMTVERFRIMEGGQWKDGWHEGDTERFKKFLVWWNGQAEGAKDGRVTE